VKSLRSALKAAGRRSRCLRHHKVALIDGTPDAMPAADVAKPAQPAPSTTPARDRHVAIALALVEHAD
jgi:hypothetical protein